MRTNNWRMSGSESTVYAERFFKNYMIKDVLKSKIRLILADFSARQFNASSV